MEVIQDFCFLFSHVALETSSVCPFKQRHFSGNLFAYLGLVGFLLLQYSVLFTVESLSLLYLLVIF